MLGCISTLDIGDKLILSFAGSPVKTSDKIVKVDLCSLSIGFANNVIFPLSNVQNCIKFFLNENFFNS